jgi:hypothetical protein
MIRGIYCIRAKEVRLKLLHRTYGSRGLQGVWTASDRWLVNTTFNQNTLLLGVESDRDTKRKLKSEMRGDCRVTVIPGGFFREEVQEVVDFDLPVEKLASGPDFGAFWTMAAGFGSAFKEAICQGLSPGSSVSKALHDADIIRDDGPAVVLYRNFLDDETCMRLRPDLWESLSHGLAQTFDVPMIERDHITFDGQTYDLSSTVRMDRDLRN